MSNVIKQDRNGFWQFVIGLFFGAIVFVIVAAAATYYLRSHHYCSTNRFSNGVTNCIPAFEYALLKSTSWGPASIVSLAQPSIRMTETQWQEISAAFFALLAGVLFVFQSHRSPMEIFLIAFFVLTIFTAFLILMIILAG